MRELIGNFTSGMPLKLTMFGLLCASCMAALDSEQMENRLRRQLVGISLPRAMGRRRLPGVQDNIKTCHFKWCGKNGRNCTNCKPIENTKFFITKTGKDVEQEKAMEKRKEKAQANWGKLREAMNSGPLKEKLTCEQERKEKVQANWGKLREAMKSGALKNAFEELTEQERKEKNAKANWGKLREAMKSGALKEKLTTCEQKRKEKAQANWGKMQEAFKSGDLKNAFEKLAEQKREERCPKCEREFADCHCKMKFWGGLATTLVGLGGAGFGSYLAGAFAAGTDTIDFGTLTNVNCLMVLGIYLAIFFLIIGGGLCSKGYGKTGGTFIFVALASSALIPLSFVGPAEFQNATANFTGDQTNIIFITLITSVGVSMAILGICLMRKGHCCPNRK